MEHNSIFTKTIYYAFLTLFFTTPLLVSISSSELFEFPKMLFVYLVTVIIAVAWIGNMIISGTIYHRRSWLDIPLLLVVLTQLISTIYSIHPHTSWYGYYSRFNGGMFSTLSYCLLTWAFINHASKSWVRDMLLSAMASGGFISTYAIAEHYGIDASMWIQDVQNRVFSTLGQPNWLAAWIGALLPFSMLWFLKPLKSIWPVILAVSLVTLSGGYAVTYLVTQNPLPLSGKDLGIFLLSILVINSLVFWQIRSFLPALRFLNRYTFFVITILFTLAILYSKSRSGLLALIASLVVFFTAWFIKNGKRNFRQKEPYILIGTVLGLILLVGTEWTPTLAQMVSHQQKRIIKNPLSQSVQKENSPFSGKVSDSTDIRKVVWKGALNVWADKPYFGSGTETFAYAYYQSRPREHNDLSEWDFLYNKAHNEYLNFLANNGLAGLTAIFLLIAGIVWDTIRPKRKQWGKIVSLTILAAASIYFVQPHLAQLIIDKLLIYPPLAVPVGLAVSLAAGLWVLVKILIVRTEADPSRYDIPVLAALTSIVVTNFYGFSVVTVSLLFFLLGAFLVISKQQWQLSEHRITNPLTDFENVTMYHLVAGLALLIAGGYFVWQIGTYYVADSHYADSKTLSGQRQIISATEEIDQAIMMRSGEADYYVQKATLAAQTAYALYTKDKTDSTDMIKKFSEQADSFASEAIKSNPVHVNVYKSVSKVYLTLAIIDTNYYPQAIQTLQEAFTLSPTDPQIALNLGMLFDQLGQAEIAEQYLKESVALKPNYQRAWLTLGQFYEDQKNVPSALEAYHFVLTNIDPQDKQSLESIKRLEIPPKTKKGAV